MSSWVKVSRRLLTSAIASKPEYLAVWMHLILTASYKPGEVLVGHQVVKLDAGQLVFGRIKFAQQIGVSEHTLRMALKSLETLQQITIKSHSKFSVITVTNWDKYQTDSPASHQQATSKPPASHHNKEVQEGKEVNQKPKRSRSSSADDSITADQMAELGIDLQNAKDWISVRKAKRSGALTQTAFNGLCREAAAAGISASEAIRMCAERSWVSFKAEYISKGGQHGQEARTSGAVSAVGRVTAKAAERERARQGTAPQHFEQGDFIEGEFSTG